ncbi:MAG: type IV pilus assembly protein PilM [Actinomycetales bacterium]|nr:type IV pilus assembly protein PilM [Actinomycetales bacterium]
MSGTIVGLDFGHGVIRAAEIQDAGKARPTLVRYASLRVPATAVQRGEVIEPGTVSAALKQLWSRGRFKTKRVVLGMGNQRVLVRDLTVPNQPLNRIRESLPFQVQDLLPVPVADAILDYYPVSVVKADGGEMVNGLLVAAMKEAVLANVDAVSAAGLSPVEVDLIPFALSRAFLASADARGVVALVHIGAVTTSVVVANDGVPQFVRIMQNGGGDVDLALQSRLSIDAEQADRIKRGIGLAREQVPAEWAVAVEAIHASTGDLLGAVRNTLSYFLNSRPGLRIERVLVSGGGAQLGGLPNALADALRLPVGVPKSIEGLAIARTVDTEQLNDDPAGLPVAAGLALGSRA